MNAKVTLTDAGRALEAIRSRADRTPAYLESICRPGDVFRLIREYGGSPEPALPGATFRFADGSLLECNGHSEFIERPY